MSLLLVLFLLAPSQKKADAWAESKVVLEKARIWKAGESLPAGLRHLRKSSGCFPEPMDTGLLVAQIENEPLLIAFVLEPGVDDAVSESALARLLDLAGPNRTFEALRQRWPVADSPRRAWFRTLRDRMSRRHVVVDSLFISESDMAPAAAEAALDRIERDLHNGIPWSRVYHSYSFEFGYSAGSTTKIGNLGSLVVFDDPALHRPRRTVKDKEAFIFEGEPLPRHLSHLAFLQGTHVQPILAAHVGAILRLWDPDLQQRNLYQVREVYEGGRAPNKSLQRTRLRAPLSSNTFGDGKSRVGEKLAGRAIRRKILAGG